MSFTNIAKQPGSIENQNRADHIRKGGNLP